VAAAGGDGAVAEAGDMLKVECPDPGAPTSKTDTPDLAGYIEIATDKAF